MVLLWPIRFDVTIVSTGNNCYIQPDWPESPLGKVVKLNLIDQNYLVNQGNPLYNWVLVYDKFTTDYLETLSSKQGSAQAMYGEGCEVVAIVTSQLSCEIKRKQGHNHQLNIDHVNQALDKFEMELIILYREAYYSTYWGRVLFKDKVGMEMAFEEINANDDLDFSLAPCDIGKWADDHRNEIFSIKLRWPRRTGLKHCYVKLKISEDKERLVGFKIKVGTADPVKVQESTGQSDLYMCNLKEDVTYQQVKEALAKLLERKHWQKFLENNPEHFHVIIPHKDTPYKKNEMEYVHKIVSTQVSNFVELDKFKVKVKQFQEQDIYCSAYVTFFDANDCKTATDGLLRSGIRLGNDIAKVTVRFQGFVNIPENVLEPLKADIDEYLTHVNEKLMPWTLKVFGDDSKVYILAPPQHKLAKMRKDIDGIVRGSLVECCSEDCQEKLFTSEAQERLDEIAADTETEILVNNKARKVTLRGLKKNRKHALRQIKDYLSDIAEANEGVIDLTPETTHAGLMKALLVRYGPDLKDMRSETDLKVIKLILKEHKIRMLGDEDALLKAEELVNHVEEEMAQCDNDSEGETRSDNDEPVCPVCLGPVDCSDFFALRLCHHAYCKVCLVALIYSCVKNQDFPMKCMAADCGESVAMRDIDKLCDAGLIEKQDIVQASVRSFVIKNESQYRFCVSPMCGTVYRVCEMSLKCPECKANICTSCHVVGVVPQRRNCSLSKLQLRRCGTTPTMCRTIKV